MKKVRVLVVEDSLTVRKRLCEVLKADGQIELIAEAADGKSAIDLCQRYRPDVVTMDMMLPIMTGLGATEYIMAHCPTPILVVSSSTNRGELFKTYDALAAGAVDVLEKPRGDEPDGTWEDKFLATVKLVARIRVITHPRARLAALGHTPGMVHATSLPVAFDPAPTAQRCALVALGASTGGPGAIVEVLREIPGNFALPMLLVLHIGEPFGSAFAEWLDRQSVHRVTYAEDGQPVAAGAGRVVMAPPDRHLLVRDGRLRLTRDPERHSCRPSVDVLFESLAREHAPSVAACLLTGMGKDGAAGLLAVRRAGGRTFAQDEATSVVWGMPGEAVALGAVQRVLPVGELGAALAMLAKNPREAER